MSKENFINNDDSFERFCDINLDALNKHTPRKKNHARGNQMLFFNKEFSKAITTQTKLQNISLQKVVRKIVYFIQNKEMFVSLF